MSRTFEEWWDSDDCFPESAGMREAVSAAWHARDAEVAALEQELQVLKTWLCKAHLPTQAHPGGTCFVCNALKMSAAERAATLREATETALKYRHGPIRGTDLETAILALIDPAEASALDRERAEARAEGYKEGLANGSRQAE